MKRCSLYIALFAAFTTSLFTQVIMESKDYTNPLFRDSEQWIRERARWFFEQRAYPTGIIPDGVRERAATHALAMPRYAPAQSFSKQSGLSTSRWQLVGPSNIGGRVTGIALDPTNPARAFFTAADGGIWRTLDTGKTFTPVADSLVTMAMGSVTIDPNNPNIIYVGTGEANFSGDSYPGIGVVKSIDGGNTWTQVGVKFSSYIGRIMVHPTNSSIVIACSRDGIYRSTNAGGAWTRVLTGTANDMAFKPGNPNIMFAGVQTAGIMKSTDAGVTWTALASIAPGAPKDSIGRISLDICESAPDVVYVVVVKNSGGSLRGVYKSTDEGATWTKTVSSPNFFNSQGWYNCTLVVNPTSPDTVFIGGVSLYYSTNGGYNWQTRGGPHVDHHALEWYPTQPFILWDGNDGGMYKSTNRGASFTSLNGNLPITQFYELGVAEQNAALMYGGTQDNGTKKGTGTVNWSNASGGDGGYAVIDYTNSNIVYAEYQNGSRLKSTNGGSSFSALNDGISGSGLWVTPIVIHPTNPNILFTSSTTKLYKTTNGGKPWFSFNSNIDSSSSINTIAISRVNPDVMIVGKTTGKVWITTNAGVSWTNPVGGLPNKGCTEVETDPQSQSTFYATFSGYSGKHVFKTTNYGTNWTDISGNLPDLPTNCIAVNPYYTNIIYVGTDFGVYVSETGGTTWQSLLDGFPKSVVVDLDIHRTTGVIRAATHGRSIFELGILVDVEMTSFTAHVDGDDVLLSWRTASETNNRGFAIERKLNDSAVWEEVAFVDGQGTTGLAQFYTHRDPITSAMQQFETIRYRIKQIDFDGTTEYSHEVFVQLHRSSDATFQLDHAYPNPLSSTAPIATVRYCMPRMADVRIVITDLLGRELIRVLDQRKAAGEYVAHFDVSPLLAGTYFYHMIADGNKRTHKFTVVR